LGSLRGRSGLEPMAGFMPLSRTAWRKAVRIAHGNEGFAVRVLEKLIGHCHFVPPPRRERDVDRAAPWYRRLRGVCLKNLFENGPEHWIGPPFPPDASWCARTTEPSTIEPVSSTSICSSSKIVAQCPFLAQLANRL
jgi:hypothetical protein